MKKVTPSRIERNLDTRTKIQRYLEKKKEDTAILFADLADSTKYKAERSFYDGLAKTRDHNTTISDIVVKQNGTVIKWIGDAVMARFDLTERKAHTHDAINAAIKIQEEFDRRNNKLTIDLEKFGTRIGIGVGPTVDFHAADPQGLAVDEAARIQALCKPGQILIHGKLRDMADVTKISSEYQLAKKRSPNSLFSRPIERRFKGIPQPVPVIEVIWGEHQHGLDQEERKLSREERDRMLKILLENTRLLVTAGLKFRANIMLIDEAKGMILIPRGLHYKMDGYDDRGIELPRGDGCTGRAFNRKDQVFANRKETIFKLVPSEMKKVPVNLKFILSTPIYDPDDQTKVIGVYNIDGFRLLKPNEIKELKAKARAYQRDFGFLI